MLPNERGHDAAVLGGSQVEWQHVKLVKNVLDTLTTARLFQGVVRGSGTILQLRARCSSSAGLPLPWVFWIVCAFSKVVPPLLGGLLGNWLGSQGPDRVARGHKPASAGVTLMRHDISDWPPVDRHDEGPAGGYPSHDHCVVMTQLGLPYFRCHGVIMAHT
ncbi:hypothetical protein [Arthrobacter dokdonensis]|uniref:hypothetical protein n=1 Tax=Arthrobacter dokdonellae TaxID=2211210 RepID=UPI0014948787|nr:hypothetical protein [Arthrobacter dokdonellae]